MEECVKALAAVSISLAVALLAVPPRAAAQAAPGPVSAQPDGTPVPRTPDGRADLSGVWNKRLVLNTAQQTQPLPWPSERARSPWR
jgi:hypothetical protein